MMKSAMAAVYAQYESATLEGSGHLHVVDGQDGRHDGGGERRVGPVVHGPAAELTPVQPEGPQYAAVSAHATSF
jgi:hypothetical protein